MIKSIKVKNFERHKESILNLSPGINIIIGDNDSGKSALSRSIEQIALNPIGDDYRSNFVGDKEETTIEIKIEDHSIKKIRSKSKNQYQIDNKQPLEAFGRGNVPESVKDLLNIDGINIQPQKEPAFLLTSNSGKIAKYLNEIVNLEEIDRSLLFIKRKKKTVNHDIESLRIEVLDPLEKELEQYANLELWEDKLNEIEENSKRLAATRSTYEKTISMLETLNDLYHELMEDKKVVKYKSRVTALLQKSKRSCELKVKIQRAFNLIAEVSEQKIQKEKYKNVWEHKDKLSILMGHCDSRYKICSKIIKIEKKLRDLESENKIKINLMVKIKAKKSELNKIMPDICPFCNQKIKGKNENSNI